jgi:hypothetical protein
MLVALALHALVAVRRAETPWWVALAVVETLDALPGPELAEPCRGNALAVTGAPDTNVAVRITASLCCHRAVGVRLARQCAPLGEWITHGRPRTLVRPQTLHASPYPRVAVRPATTALVVRVAFELHSAPRRILPACVASQLRWSCMIRACRSIELDRGAPVGRQQKQLAPIATRRDQTEKRNERFRRHPRER